MGIKAALLDERGIYTGMDEVASVEDFGPRHLPQIVTCDLPPGRYLWVPDDRTAPNGRPANPYGGAFWELAWLQRVARTRREAAAVRVKNARRDPAPKDGVDLDALAAYLEERGLA